MPKLKSKDIEVDEDNPFLYDGLEREESGKALTNFVLKADEALVLSIDAPWGQGKTTFLRMWEQSLKNDGFPTVYFNAWESDFSDDALVCLIGEVRSAIEENESGSFSDKALKQVVKAGGALTKRALPLFVKAATLGVIDSKEYEKIAADWLASVTKEQLERYTAAKSSIVEFRNHLQELAESMSGVVKKRPLVFIIDELDRCRPSFSIEVLEKAKHFFNVENIIFVLGIDKQQLGSSFSAVYGDGLDVDGYLRRFIDFEYKLPEPDKGMFSKFLIQQLSLDEHLLRVDARQETDLSRDDIETWLSDLFDIFGLTLREQEHCCSLLSLAIKVSDPEEDILPIFLCFLVVLKIKKPSFYAEFVIRRTYPKWVLTELRNTISLRRIFDLPLSDYLQAYIMTSNSDGEGYSDYYKECGRAVNELDPFTRNRDDNYGKLQRAQLNIVQRIDNHPQAKLSSLEYLVKKIDLAARFNS